MASQDEKRPQSANHVDFRNRLELTAQVGDKPEKERKRDAKKKASDNGKVKSGVFAAMNDVAGKLSQTEGELVAEVQKSTDQEQKCSKEKKSAAEIEERLHEVILPEAANKMSQTMAIRLNRCWVYSLGHPGGASRFSRLRTAGFAWRYAPNQISSMEEQK